MNILLDDLPHQIDGIPINSDYRAMVLFELMLADPQVPPDQKIPLAISYLYQKPVRDLQRAVDGLLWFYRCGSPEEKSCGRGGKTRERAYDFEQDAPLIYAAFLQVYGIDLNSAPLHWWKFIALFSALPEACRISKIMGYRTMDLSELGGAEKKQYEKLQNKFRLQPLGIEKMSLAAAEQALKGRVDARFAAAEAWGKEAVKN